jgi:hypothetical protein
MDSPKEKPKGTPIDEFGQLYVISLGELPKDLRYIINEYVDFNTNTVNGVLAIFKKWYDDMPYKIINPLHSFDGDDSDELLLNFAKYYIKCAYFFLVDPWLEQLPNDRTNLDVWEKYTDELEFQHDVIIIQFVHFRGHNCYATFEYQDCNINRGNCAECDCTTDTIYLSLFSELESMLDNLTIESVFDFFKSKEWALVDRSNFTAGGAITGSGYSTTKNGKYVKLTIDVPYASLIQDVEKRKTSHDYQNNPRPLPHCTHCEYNDKGIMTSECKCDQCDDSGSDY